MDRRSLRHWSIVARARPRAVQLSVIPGLLAWANERFPLAVALMAFVLYATALSYGRLLTTEGAIPFRSVDLVGFFAGWSFFLMLRVFDEHKDFETDLHNHPQRVLQSGRITLNDLKVLGGLAIGVQIGVSLWIDQGFGRVIILWCVVLGWSILMAFEFFCGEWLQKRLLLYAGSHMLVMPMAMLWMAQMGTAGAPLPSDIGWLGLLSLLSGAALEIARKIKAPAQERETVDSYTRVFGTTRAPLVVMGLLLGGTSTVLVLMLRLQYPDNPAVWWYVLVVIPLLPALWGLQHFRRCPLPKAAKTAEGLVGLATMGSYGVLLAALYAHRGVQWMSG